MCLRPRKEMQISIMRKSADFDRLARHQEHLRQVRAQHVAARLQRVIMPTALLERVARQMLKPRRVTTGAIRAKWPRCIDRRRLASTSPGGAANTPGSSNHGR
jgi:hypothetical protein